MRTGEALGPPEEFAADAASAYPEEQSRRDTQGKTPRGHLEDGLFVAAFLGLPVSVFGGIVAGAWSMPVTVAGLTGSILCAFAAVATQVPGAVRAAGLPKLAPWSFALFGVLVMAAAAAFTGLPRTSVGELPVLALLAVSLAAMWLLTREPSVRRSSGDLPDPGGARGGPARGDGGRAAGGEGGAGGGEAWFGRLRALLVGRFDVPPRRAAALVEQARSHVAASGSEPEEEFGPAARYARELAEAEPVRQGPWWRGDTAELAMSVVITGWIVVVSVEAAVDGRWWLAALGVVCLVGIGPQAWRRVRKRAAGSKPV
ncbi:hypothetical protein ACTI_41920 [Actinoplanes sp. OR16]|uniref:hypothetical protein n=1 Tax=Actinoplanes sp. OR16 TaxID=946334 RepID=UPI000F70B0B8|nr:hypothetical protein [Actinoplanes sp. OR16]BBH67507.1 hypothetical protein ACTI_41920 [Actinoplanes sp. OR16]